MFETISIFLLGLLIGLLFNDFKIEKIMNLFKKGEKNE